MDILLVDDDETLRESLKMLLSSEDYRVEAAASGEEAQEMARQRYFDLVLCDVRMPGIDGLEAIRRLQEVISDAYFMVMTGYASEDAPIEALRLGVDDYLTKPFDIPLFLEKLRAVARRRKSLNLNANLSVWNLVESLRDNFPGLAAKCEPVEETTRQCSELLELSVTEQEALQLAAWLHPLTQSTSHEEADSDSGAEFSLLSELARLLQKLANGDGQLMPDLLGSAIALHDPRQTPEPRNSEVLKALEQCERPQQETETENPSRRLEVRTLGGLEVFVNSKTVDRRAWKSASAKWLFVYLLSRGGQSVPEDRLAQMFWPGSPSKKAHRALVSSIHRARKALGCSELLARYDRSYGLQRECDYWLDSEHLYQTYKTATQHFYSELAEKATAGFRKVLELYRGPYLPDCHETWCLKTREDIKLKVVDSAEKLAQLHLNDNPSQAEAYCRRALSMEPTSEPAWATLFRALAEQGRRTEVIGAFEECKTMLQEKLGLSPGSGLRQCYEECAED